MKKRTIYRFVGEKPTEVSIRGEHKILKPGQFISEEVFMQLPGGFTITQVIP